MSTPDVIHDPRTDWCACEPNGMNRCDYRMLADAVIERLNPPDGDAAEVSICEAKVARLERENAELRARQEGS